MTLLQSYIKIALIEYCNAKRQLERAKPFQIEEYKRRLKIRQTHLRRLRAIQAATKTAKK